MDYHLLHGECVAIGMAVEMNILKDMGHFSEQDYYHAISLIRKYNLTLLFPSLIIHSPIHFQSFIRYLSQDKKNHANAQI
jgi:3-dehydroquinate synthetase